MPDEAAAPPPPGSNIIKHVIYSVVGFIVAFLFVFMVMALYISPAKPIFTLQDITVSAFNVSTTQPYYLSTNLQVTISSTNTMSRVAVIYKEMSLYATYRNEQITLRYSLPMTYQEHAEVVVWSPYLQGHVETISPISGPVLMQDLDHREVLVLIKVDGRMKFRFGGLTSLTYKLYGHCPATIHLWDMSAKMVQNCRIEITK